MKRNISVTSFPKPPPKSEWKFIDELKKPLHIPIAWSRFRAGRNEVAVGAGVNPCLDFPDPNGLLVTAFTDFRRFLQAGGIPVHGPYPIRIEQTRCELPETYTINVRNNECRILAGDTEGVRRALIALENLILQADGPILPLGARHYEPVIRTRIRWACYGRKADDRPDAYPDDYPDGYLNRMAHDGCNGLGLKASFYDICYSPTLPELGRYAAIHQERLRKLTCRCLRYGLRVFLYVNAPHAFAADDPALKAHPDLMGRRIGNMTNFCTSSATGQRYLREAVCNLFTAVPDLGGLFDITVGERPTHCWSAITNDHTPNNCPRCGHRPPAEVLGEMLDVMADNMHKAAPQALMISWPYTQYALWGIKRAAASAGHMPASVVVMYNFESAGQEKQLGKMRFADDYWLSYVGPSQFFRQCARNAVRHGCRIFAKLTVAASHEVGTVVCIPVPGILYEKYRAMRRLGVSGAVETWDFGNYPSLMTKAAGLLSFNPFPKSKSEFLLTLARWEWGRHAATVAQAWKHFEAGYRNVPLNILFSYFGPLHDAPIWPLYLKPRDTVLAPKWFFGNPRVDGDRIGECVTYAHTLQEDIILCERIVLNWKKGVALLRRIERACAGHREQMKEIRTARALGLQFESALDILRFYEMRERLFREKPARRPALLAGLRALVAREIELDKELLPLTEEDPHLGFHPEANGHRYFPAAIRWRINWLKQLLATEFAEVDAVVRFGKPLFPDYTGLRPKGAVYRSAVVSSDKTALWRKDGALWQTAPEGSCSYDGFRYARTTALIREKEPGKFATLWQTAHDGKALYVRVVCALPHGQSPAVSGKDRSRLEPLVNDLVLVYLEPRRLWPAIQFMVNAKGHRYYIKPTGGSDLSYDWQVWAGRIEAGWEARFRIPFAELGLAGKPAFPLRINVGRQMPDAGRNGFHYFFWIRRNPLPERLCWGTDNPKDLGWLAL